jgi:hypothetical protein
MGKPQFRRGLGRIKVPLKNTFAFNRTAQAPYYRTGLEYRLGIKAGPPPACRRVKQKNLTAGKEENTHFQGNVGLVHRKTSELSWVRGKMMSSKYCPDKGSIIQ